MTGPRYSLEELEAHAEALDFTLAELVEEWAALGRLPVPEDFEGDDDGENDDDDDDDDDEGDE